MLGMKQSRSLRRGELPASAVRRAETDSARQSLRSKAAIGDASGRKLTELIVGHHQEVVMHCQ